MQSELLHVREEGHNLAFGIADLNRYHGVAFPGGVAHGFKVMQRALPLLAGGDPPERRRIEIRTAFRGPGARDAFELVTRAVTGSRYIVDAALERPERGETVMRYVFVLTYEGTTVRLQIREGIVRDEFIALGRKPDRTPAEEQRLLVLKRDMADRLLATPATEAYDVL